MNFFESGSHFVFAIQKQFGLKLNIQTMNHFVTFDNLNGGLVPTVFENLKNVILCFFRSHTFLLEIS